LPSFDVYKTRHYNSPSDVIVKIKSNDGINTDNDWFRIEIRNCDSGVNFMLQYKNKSAKIPLNTMIILQDANVNNLYIDLKNENVIRHMASIQIQNLPNDMKIQLNNTQNNTLDERIKRHCINNPNYGCSRINASYPTAKAKKNKKLILEDQLRDNINFHDPILLGGKVDVKFTLKSFKLPFKVNVQLKSKYPDCYGRFAFQFHGGKRTDDEEINDELEMECDIQECKEEYLKMVRSRTQSVGLGEDMDSTEIESCVTGLLSLDSSSSSMSVESCVTGLLSLDSSSSSMLAWNGGRSSSSSMSAGNGGRSSSSSMSAGNGGRSSSSSMSAGNGDRSISSRRQSGYLY
jgi:hypothetical protein